MCAQCASRRCALGHAPCAGHCAMCGAIAPRAVRHALCSARRAPCAFAPFTAGCRGRVAGAVNFLNRERERSSAEVGRMQAGALYCAGRCCEQMSCVASLWWRLLRPVLRVCRPGVLAVRRHRSGTCAPDASMRIRSVGGGEQQKRCGVFPSLGVCACYGASVGGFAATITLMAGSTGRPLADPRSRLLSTCAMRCAPCAMEPRNHWRCARRAPCAVRLPPCAARRATAPRVVRRALCAVCGAQSAMRGV